MFQRVSGMQKKLSKSQEGSQASQKRCHISRTVSPKSGELGKRSGMGHTQRVKRVLSSVSKPEESQKAARMSNLSKIVWNNEKGYMCVTKGFINDREHVTDTKIGRVSELLHTRKTVNNFGMVSHSHEGCQTSPGVSPVIRNRPKQSGKVSNMSASSPWGTDMLGMITKTSEKVRTSSVQISAV